MLNAKSIDRSIDKYSQTDDESLKEGLVIFGTLAKTAAQIAGELKHDDIVWTKDELMAALTGKETLLSLGKVKIDPAAFEEALKTMAASFVKAADLPDDLRSICESVNWAEYAVPALVETAAKDPLKYMDAIEALSDDEDLLDVFIFPVVGSTLRAFLDSYATEASREIDALMPDTTHVERPVACPVCGSTAAIAAVAETQHAGNVKRLYCTCCGADWKFERIRCAICGDEAVSDLEYVHEENDDKHRLHVCKGCGQTMPTVFAGEALGFSPDIEAIVMSRLEAYFDETHEAPEETA